MTKMLSTLATILRDCGGERGIRTPGEFPHNGFQDRRLKPLGHLSRVPAGEHHSVPSMNGQVQTIGGIKILC
jgi:hypothetical protein